MVFTKAERAEIIAGMRKLQAEGKDRVHVIPSRGGWRVFREGTRRGGKSFQERDEAVAYGRDLADLLQKDLVIHMKDGGLESWLSFPDRAEAHGSSGL
jgi:hypothetical protein